MSVKKLGKIKQVRFGYGGFDSPLGKMTSWRILTEVL